MVIIHKFRGGQIVLLGGHYENATHNGGLYLLMETEASLG